MKIENKPFTFFDYIDSLKSQQEYWKKEMCYQEFNRKNSDIATILFYIASSNYIMLDVEILKLTVKLEV